MTRVARSMPALLVMFAVLASGNVATGEQQVPIRLDLALHLMRTRGSQDCDLWVMLRAIKNGVLADSAVPFTLCVYHGKVGDAVGCVLSTYDIRTGERDVIAMREDRPCSLPVVQSFEGSPLWELPCGAEDKYVPIIHGKPKLEAWRRRKWAAVCAVRGAP